MILNTTERRVAMKTLRDVKTGSTVKVVKLYGEGAIKRKIMNSAEIGRASCRERV